MRNFKAIGRAAAHQVAGVSDTTIGRALGWASVGVAAAELAAPKQIEQMLGIHNGQNTGIIRALGVRELMHGVDLLTHDDPTNGVCARVVGDMLDGALLGMAAKQSKRPGGLLLAAALVLPLVLADVLFCKHLMSER